MPQLFLHIVNMSISASYIVLAVLLLRLPLKKAPRWVAVLLWGIVAVRLVCPFSPESVLSLIPSAEVVSPDIMTDTSPEINTGIPILNNTFNPIIGEALAPAQGDSANPMQLLVPVFAVLWAVGALALLSFTVISYVRVKLKIGTAVLLSDNVYQSEKVDSPFVLGLVRPKIYLPFNISEQDSVYVVAHEQAHIRRGDHIWKPIGFLLLSVYWFNPLVWFGYILLCRDIELACDEKVIRALDCRERADYSQALLTCSINRRMIAACPLAFGEVGVKARVRSVLNYKKPAFWIILAAIVVCVAVSVCFLTNPVSESGNPGDNGPRDPTGELLALQERVPEYFGLDTSEGLNVFVWQMAKNSYSFGLVSPAEPPLTNITSMVILDKGVSAEEMRVILSTYDIPEDKVNIVLWQNPISSYISEWQIKWEGEDFEAKRKAYADAIRRELLGYEYQGEEKTNDATLIYSAPALSWVTSDVPRVLIDSGKLYDKDSGQLLGAVTKATSATSALQQLTNEYGGYYSQLAEELQQNNDIIYEVQPWFPEGVDLYYVMIQNDGSALLVYGHYKNGEKSDFLRWIFRMENQM